MPQNSFLYYFWTKIKERDRSIEFSSKDVIIRAILASGASYSPEFIDSMITDLLQESNDLKNSDYLRYHGRNNDEVSYEELNDLLKEVVGD